MLSKSFTQFQEKQSFFFLSLPFLAEKKNLYKKNVSSNFSIPTFFELLSRGWEDFEPTLKTDNEPPCINYYIIQYTGTRGFLL